jgi:hypothetical protein
MWITRYMGNRRPKDRIGVVGDGLLLRSNPASHRTHYSKDGHEDRYPNKKPTELGLHAFLLMPTEPDASSFIYASQHPSMRTL